MTAFRTTLEKRTQDVTHEDFVGLKRLNINGRTERDILGRHLDDWNERIPYSPDQIYGLLSQGYSDEPWVSFDLATYGEMFLRISGKGGVFSSMLAYYFEPTFRNINSSLSVEPEHRGQGYGKIWMRNALEFSRAMGADHFKFTATNENGAYSWARAKAYLNLKIEGFEERRQEISQRCLARLEIIRDYLPQSDFHLIKALCRVLAKDDLVRLAEMTHLSVPMEFKPDSMDVTRHPRYDDLVGFYTDLDTDKAATYMANVEMFRLCNVFEQAIMQGHRTINVPRYLLSGGSWPGIYDFQDEKQMCEAGEYFGGWKTIQPSTQQPANKLTAEFV